MKNYQALIAKCLILLSLGSFSVHSADSPSSWPSELARRFMGTVDGEVDQGGERFRASIFESISDLHYRFIRGYGLTGTIDIRRQVFDNQDILNTWTVIDHFDIPLNLPINIVDPVALGTSGALSLNLGVRFGLNSLHIRQVTPEEANHLPDINQLRRTWEAELQEDEEDDSDELRADLLYSDEDLDQPDFMENLFQFITFDRDNPRTRARYSRLTNLFLSPLGLPLTPKLADKMPEGDIRSYSLEGAVQFGPSIGWGQIDLPVVGETGLSTGVVTYLRGQWRISVWKENEHEVQVKLTKDRGRGLNAHLGGRSSDHVVFDGVFILGHRVGRISSQVIPFHFSANREMRTSFEVGYRYDLRDEQSRAAYAQAIFGRFKKSDELVQKEHSGIEQVFTREQEELRRRRTYQTRLSFFYERLNTSGLSDAVAEITLNGREYHVFRSVADTTVSSDSLWGTSKLNSIRFIAELDEADYLRGQEGLSLRLEGRIENSRTRTIDYLESTSLIEHLTGLTDFFPEVPRYSPEQLARPECLNPTPAQIRDLRRRRMSCPVDAFLDLKDSSFFFQVGYSRNQVERLFTISDEKMWEILERGFGIKEGHWSDPGQRFFYGLRHSVATAINPALSLGDLHLASGDALYAAQRFHRQWRELKHKQYDPQAFVQGLAKLFSTRRFSYQLAQVLKLSFEQEEVALYVQGRAPRFFGQLSYLNGNFDPIDRISSTADDVIGFDRQGPRPSVDRSAVVQAFSITYRNSDLVEVRFTLPKDPELLYLRVDRTPNWGRYRNLLKSIVLNRGEFTEGQNVLMIRREGEEGLLGTLAELLFSGEILTFSFAVSNDSQNWGGMAQSRFRTRE